MGVWIGGNLGRHEGNMSACRGGITAGQAGGKRGFHRSELLWIFGGYVLNWGFRGGR